MELIMTLEEKGKEYATKMWGEFYDNTYDESCNMLSYGEVCEKDFKRGSIEGQIHLLEEMLKNDAIRLGVKKEAYDMLDKLKSYL
jgi:hypothetical protein